MNGDKLTRRLFLQGSAGTALARSGIAGLAALAESACTARDEGAAYATLSSAEAREFEAIAARILPTTDTPGAREAGVVWFIDKAFGSFGAEHFAFAQEGLASFQAAIPDSFPGAQKFSDLGEDDQDRHLQTQQDSDFFGLARFLTIMGFFSMSKYGGNRDNAGWKLVGLDGPHQAWQPPFGHYDAEFVAAAAAAGEQHGE
jgi:gluconate 2-dehydrogenase gamma chain